MSHEAHTTGLVLKVKNLSRAELEELAVNAMYHLRVVSGSRNSFSSHWLEEAAKRCVYTPERDLQVGYMHRRAAEFLEREDV